MSCDILATVVDMSTMFAHSLSLKAIAAEAGFSSLSISLTHEHTELRTYSQGQWIDLFLKFEFCLFLKLCHRVTTVSTI